MIRTVLHLSLIVTMTLALVVGCGCQNQKDPDVELLNNSRTLHPDKDTSEFGKIYAKARKRPDNRYGDILLKVGETNLKISEEGEKYRIIFEAGINSTPQQIVSVSKTNSKIRLIVYQLSFHVGKFGWEKKQFDIKPSEFRKFVLLLDSLDLTRFKSKVSDKQITFSIHPSICYVEGIKNGEYFQAGEELLDGSVLGVLCSYWSNY